MNDIEKKLFKILANQQTIITALVKRAQLAPPPQEISSPNKPRFRDAEAILKFLPPVVRAAVKTIQVQPSRDPQFDAIVKVLFVPGKSSDSAFAAIQKAVATLQAQNILQGKNYNIQEVA